MAPSKNGKRAIEFVDLTQGDDNLSLDPQRRKVPRTELNDGVTNRERETSIDQDVEEDADDVIFFSQDGDNIATESYELYGVLQTKIVGIQYYNGHATIGEFVMIQREPSNPYDRNAIRVNNVRREQIGHIPRQTASKLASYMDDGALLVEGAIAGQKGGYNCPIHLRLFGTGNPIERANLRNRMELDRLPVEVLDRREREAQKQRATELKRLQTAKKGTGLRPGGQGQQWEQGSSQTQYMGSQSQGNSVPVQSLEDIMHESQRFNPREMGEVVEKFGVGEAVLEQMPMAEPPEALATKLLPYQRQALAWLLEKESPQLPPVGSTDVVQLWKRSSWDSQMFTNIATNFSIKDQLPTLASGGILADDMGLGKTLEMISLIVADPNLKGSPNKTTLIVAPLGVMSNWSSQIAHHIRPESALRVYVYHGASKKLLSPEELCGYDVVITTYGALSTEYLPRGTKVPPSVPMRTGLFSMKWRRIILDEGHNIRNPNIKTALAATALLGQSRWVLTGTPIVNNLKDLFSLVRFLKLSGGLERLEVFNSVLIRPLNVGSEEANLLLQALMGTVCLRRKKEMKFIDLRLPELTEYSHRIEFHPHEKEKYEALQAEAQGLLQNVQQGHGQGRGQDKGNARENYRNLLEILLRLRQVCNHWKLCGDRITNLLSLLDSQKVLELTPENKRALQDMLQLSIESREDCPVCLEDLHNPVITACAHVFGYECIERVIETQHRCPMCRAEPLELNTLVRPAAGIGEAQDSLPLNLDINTSSSKTQALLSILAASHKKPGTKTVIFSQWTSFLDIIQYQLEANGYTFARIDGTMSPARRDKAMHALDTDPECTIMLASLAVCSVGLNLVAANQVILADSWWAPAIEDQAVDRVHRLGQTRPTTVWRLIMDGSIEERVGEIQAEKRKLMMAAFREKDGKKKESSRLGDIERLLR